MAWQRNTSRPKQVSLASSLHLPPIGYCLHIAKFGDPSKTLVFRPKLVLHPGGFWYGRMYNNNPTDTPISQNAFDDRLLNRLETS